MNYKSILLDSLRTSVVAQTTQTKKQKEMERELESPGDSVHVLTDLRNNQRPALGCCVKLLSVFLKKRIIKQRNPHYPYTQTSWNQLSFFLSFMTSHRLLGSFPMLPTRKENLSTANILCDRLLPLMSKITKTSSSIFMFNELVFYQIILYKVSLGVKSDFTVPHGGIWAIGSNCHVSEIEFKWLGFGFLEREGAEGSGRER